MMNSTKVINGSFGKVYNDGQWLDNVHGFDASCEISYNDVPKSGTRVVGKKAGAVNCTGTMNAYHTSNGIITKIREVIKTTGTPYFTELIVALDDPENTDMMREKYRIKGVQFTNIPVVSFANGENVEQELQFVFEDFEIIKI